MVLKILSFSLGLVSACFTVLGQNSIASTVGNTPESKVQWMSFQEAVERSKTEKRKIFIDVYTDWCGWCKVMDKNTFSEAHVAKILNEKFYPVKFDAEQLEDVVFGGHTYKFVPSGRTGYHQLAALLLNNKLSYPTVVFLEEDFSQSYPVPGYQKPKEFYALLVFFTENHHKKGRTAWQEFQKSYQSPF